ncbi:MAG: FAD-binding protein [bacterium]
MIEKRLKTDVLIIGGAGAGLRAAIEARVNGAEVLLLSKMPAGGTSCTLVMAGWITGATKQNEDQLFKQIVYTGGYLNNQRLLETFIRDAITVIPELREFGVPLEWRGDDPSMPGHYIASRLDNNPKGYSLLKPMKNKAESLGVTILNNTPIFDLITEDRKVIGAVGVDLNNNQPIIISSKATIIATGGGAYAFERTDNPPGSTGDGFSLAYRAGAELIDMEFISLNIPKNIMQEIPNIKGEPPDEIINVGTAHYFLGGIRIKEDCTTNLEGLFAAGEVTGGLLGAARLGGSAVADAIVFGAKAGKTAAQWSKDTNMPVLQESKIQEKMNWLCNIINNGKFSAVDVLKELKSTLWHYMGPVKSEYTLNKGKEKLSEIKNKVSKLSAKTSEEILSAIEARNIFDLGNIIAEASLMRTETRGNFWRTDYPKPDNNNWIKNIVVCENDGKVSFRTEDVVMTRLHNPVEPPIGSGCFWYFPKIDIT